MWPGSRVNSSGKPRRLAMADAKSLWIATFLSLFASQVAYAGVCGPNGGSLNERFQEAVVPDYICVSPGGQLNLYWTCGTEPGAKTVYLGGACSRHDSC